MDSVEAHLWGGPPASFSYVGGRRPRRPLPDDRNISENCGKPAGGPAADQGVRPTNTALDQCRRFGGNESFDQLIQHLAGRFVRDLAGSGCIVTAAAIGQEKVPYLGFAAPVENGFS